MFVENQKVTLDEVLEAQWTIDSHSEVRQTTAYVSPDGKQTVSIDQTNTGIIQNF